MKETRFTLVTRVHLRRVVTPAAVDAFIGLLLEVAFIPRELTEPPPAICRDPSDDYLLAQAAADRVAFLVTGDKDLLSLDQSEFAFAIATPRAFLTHLGATPPSAR